MKFTEGDMVVVKRIRDWRNHFLYSEGEDKYFTELSPLRVATVIKQPSRNKNIYFIETKSPFFDKEVFKCSEDDMILVRRKTNEY